MAAEDTKITQTYAVQTGDYVGQIFVVCEITDKVVGCLSVPVMKNVLVPTDKWTIGRNSDIIEYVETLPGEVYMISEKQYIVNEDSNN